MSGRPGVPEACLKETMPCEVSRLGYQLPLLVKETVWKGELVDVLSLLPSHKEFVGKEDKKGDEKMEDDRRRPVPRSFHNWLQAYCVFSSVMAERRPDLCGGLFQHLYHVLEAYSNFGGLEWYSYDESFRQKPSIHPALKWGIKDVGLWLNLILPPKQGVFKQPAANPLSLAYRKDDCFAFNESQCRWGALCKYKNECAYCSGAHPVIKCFKKNAGAGTSQLQREVPRQGKSSISH